MSCIGLSAHDEIFHDPVTGAHMEGIGLGKTKNVNGMRDGHVNPKAVIPAFEGRPLRLEIS